MTGHAAHAKRSWIVHLTAQPLLTHRSRVCSTIAQITHLSAALFGRRDTPYCRRVVVRRSQRQADNFAGPPEAGVMHSQGPKDFGGGKVVQHLATDSMHHFAERDVVDVAINETCSRWIAQGLTIQAFHRFVVTSPTIAQIEIVSEARHMRK